MNEEELFSRLVTGNFPENLPDVPLPVCKEALIDAVAIHQALVQKAEEDLFDAECFLEYVKEFPDGCDPDDDLLFRDGLQKEIETNKEAVRNARFLLESCDNRLMDLLEAHPELNDE